MIRMTGVPAATADSIRSIRTPAANDARIASGRRASAIVGQQVRDVLRLDHDEDEVGISDG